MLNVSSSISSSEPSGLEAMADILNESPMTVACAATGTVQPPPMAVRKARSARTAMPVSSCSATDNNFRIAKNIFCLIY